MKFDTRINIIPIQYGETLKSKLSNPSKQDPRDKAEMNCLSRDIYLNIGKCAESKQVCATKRDMIVILFMY